MKTHTIKDAIVGDGSTVYKVAGYVYVIRDGEEVFYVGISRYPELRICQHVGIANGWHLEFDPNQFISALEDGYKDDVLHRLQYGLSAVGRCIVENAPASLSWSFDVYEYQDALDALERAARQPDGKMARRYVGLASAMQEEFQEHQRRWYDYAEDVESALIDELRPYLNTAKNAHQRTLPDKYRRKEDISQGDVNPFAGAIAKMLGLKGPIG